MPALNITYINSQKQGIVAEPGGGQANATVLDHAYNIVDVCAAPSDSCKLDAGVVGNIREVFNLGSQDLELFCAIGDHLYRGLVDQGVNSSVIIGAGNGFKFRCFATGHYRYDI